MAPADRSARARSRTAELNEPADEVRAAPSLLRAAWEHFGTLALAVVIALGVRACVIEPFRIPSGSMLPTLLIGDHLFVNRFVYGIKIPFTDLRLPGLRAPARGDVVVFTVARDPTRGESVGGIHPAHERPDLPTDSFVKRIVGLPGEVVEVRGGAISVNGHPIPLEPIGGTFVDARGVELIVKREVMDGHEHLVLDDPRESREDGVWTLPPGQYFMMGDNRDQSSDSRFWGFVREVEFKGPAFVIYWSWDFNGSWLSMLSPLTWWDLLVHKARWDRIGEGIP